MLQYRLTEIDPQSINCLRSGGRNAIVPENTKVIIINEDERSTVHGKFYYSDSHWVYLKKALDLPFGIFISQENVSDVMEFLSAQHEGYDREDHVPVLKRGLSKMYALLER